MPAATIDPFGFQSYAGLKLGNNLLTSQRGQKLHIFLSINSHVIENPKQSSIAGFGAIRGNDSMRIFSLASFLYLFRADRKMTIKKAAALIRETAA